jgi:hypothetical protein
MRNNYIGDIGDFVKFGLLRALCNPTAQDGSPSLALGIIWHLTTDPEKNNDGKHIHHYSKPERYRDCDPKLFDILCTLVSDPNRSIQKIRTSELFPKTTTFFEEGLSFQGFGKRTKPAIDARQQHRSNWYERSKLSVSNCDVIFVDPDNGFETKTTKRHHDKGPKYAFYDELQFHVDQNKSLIVYQHKTRSGTVETQIKTRMLELQQILGYKGEIHTLYFSTLGGRSFFILPAKQHLEIIEKRLDNLKQSLWKKHFKCYSSSDMPC